MVEEIELSPIKENCSGIAHIFIDGIEYKILVCNKNSINVMTRNSILLNKFRYRTLGKFFDNIKDLKKHYKQGSILADYVYKIL